MSSALKAVAARKHEMFTKRTKATAFLSSDNIEWDCSNCGKSLQSIIRIL